jgi:hypothetical protein
MCFNQTTSLITFSISLVCFVYLLYYGITQNNKYDIYAAVITIMIGLMQLIEFFLWRNQTCLQTNHYLSLSIILLFWLQVFITTCVYMALFGNTLGKWSKLIWTFIGAFTVLTLYLLHRLNREQLCSKPMNGSCRLVWSPIHTLMQTNYGILLMFIFSLFYSILVGSQGGIFYEILTGKISDTRKYPLRHMFLSVTLVIAILYALIVKGKYAMDIFGTTWCFMAVGYGAVACLHI